jgi:G:T-mismatch repair DNA endonuclease (very short patch repair protein)
LYTDLDIEKLNKNIERKMNKEEAEERLENSESKIVILDKCILKVNTNVERLEVTNLNS